MSSNSKIWQTCVSKVIVFCVTPIVPESFMIVSSTSVLVKLFLMVGGFGGRSYGLTIKHKHIGLHEGLTRKQTRAKHPWNIMQQHLKQMDLNNWYNWYSVSDSIHNYYMLGGHIFASCIHGSFGGHPTQRSSKLLRTVSCASGSSARSLHPNNRLSHLRPSVFV